MLDLLIKNAEVFDGTGAPSFKADVAVKDGKIVEVAEKIECEARETIDAAGLCVSPGFVDSHSHADSNVLEYRDLPNQIAQGITTVMSGQCGGSAAPLREHDVKDGDCRRTVAEWFASLEKEGIGINVSLFTGHGNIRDYVMGRLANRRPTADEMKEMKELLAKTMDEGSRGMNGGMYYTPCAYADTNEIIELCKTVKEKGGMFAAHIRSESARLIEAVAEMIEICEKSGVTTVISHHKAVGGPNYWGKSRETLRMIEEARGRGLPIWCDVYPYNACSTSLWATFISTDRQALGKAKITEMLKTPEYRAEAREWIEETFIRHSWHEKGLSWAKMFGLKNTPQYDGMDVREASKVHGKDEFETLFDILEANECNGNGVLFTMSEEDVERIISRPYAMIGTDSGAGKGTHPRYYGTFPRVLGHYVRERKLDTWEHMIHRMTGLPATVYELDGKGFIKEGYDADICIFNKETINAGSTFSDPSGENIGLEFVIVNGTVAARHGVGTGSRSGKVLRKTNV